MKKAIILTAVAAAAFAIPTAAHADGPSASADANCDTFTVNAAGLQPGDRLVVEQGSQAPYGFDMGSGVYWQFNVDEAAGTAHAVLKATTDPWFTADVLVIRDGQYINLFHQMVDCTGTAPAVDPTLATPEVGVAVAEPTVPAASDAGTVELDVFAGVTLAPPW